MGGTRARRRLERGRLRKKEKTKTSLLGEKNNKTQCLEFFTFGLATLLIYCIKSMAKENMPNLLYFKKKPKLVLKTIANRGYFSIYNSLDLNLE